MTINRDLSIIPPFLNKGDQVEIVAASKYLTEDDIIFAIKLIESKGFCVILNKSIFIKKDVFAGSKKDRVNNLQQAFNHSTTKAIFFARGGYGAIQIIDHIDFQEFIKYPKWLIGFSDVTIFLTHLYVQYKIASIHAPMLFNFPSTRKKSLDSIFQILNGIICNIQTPFHKLNQLGHSKGILIGGNLSILCSLIGSKSFIENHQDYILFIEDVEEYLYHLERMMYTLERSGALKSLKGLIIGQMTKMMDNEIAFGHTPYDIIDNIVKKYNYPICYNFPLGHSSINHPVIVGAEVDLFVNQKYSEIHYR